VTTAVDTPVLGADRPVPCVPAPAQGLRSFQSTRPAWVWFVGCHGGAGESTLSDLLPASAAAEHRWPVHADGSVPNVVLVARTSLAGLLAAREVATQWAAGGTPPVRVLGLVLSPDAPGRLPKPLSELARVIAGGMRDRKVWHLPWVEAWRVGGRAPHQLTHDLFADISALTES
jgi:hypothetical protein